MKRLTFKGNDAYYVEEMRHLYGDTWELVQALGKYEDLEEELGIDFITLFKALYKGIYVKQLGIGNTNYMKTIITKVKAPCLKLNHETHSELVFDQRRSGGCWDTYYFKDYGKTWALTKEELVNE